MEKKAFDLMMARTLKGFNASIFYKYIQPDYVSLGTYYRKPYWM